MPPSLLELHQHMMGLVKGTFAGEESIMQRADDDAMLWSGQDAPAWVACNQRNGTCYGKISKDQWYSASKPKVCTDVFMDQVKAGLVNSSAVGLDVCNLNKKTNDLCQILKQAQTKVFEANCIFAGLCAPQVFVYSPGK